MIMFTLAEVLPLNDKISTADNSIILQFTEFQEIQISNFGWGATSNHNSRSYVHPLRLRLHCAIYRAAILFKLAHLCVNAFNLIQ